jgi:hypothetical protein
MNNQKIICLAVELKSLLASEADNNPFGHFCRSSKFPGFGGMERTFPFYTFKA